VVRTVTRKGGAMWDNCTALFLSDKYEAFGFASGADVSLAPFQIPKPVRGMPYAKN
jgi:hypothetical protein